MQTLIALLGFAVLASTHLWGHLAKKKREKSTQSDSKEPNLSVSSSNTTANANLLDHEKTHSGLLLLATEEFHILQCYFSIALQIASFVALYGGNNADRSQLDEVFLMLISADGLIPVALTLYTLMLLRRTTLYHIVLSTTSALLASATGFWIVKNYSLNLPFSDDRWPDTCGALSPQYICGFELEMNLFDSPNIMFVIAASLCDTLIFYLLLWFTLSRVKIKPLTEFKERILPQGSRSLGLVKTILHTLAVILLLACTIVELFFFIQLLSTKSGMIDMSNWGFGQIVGITVWCAVIVDLVRHEIGMLELPVPQNYLITSFHSLRSFGVPARGLIWNV